MHTKVCTFLEGWGTCSVDQERGPLGVWNLEWSNWVYEQPVSGDWKCKLPSLFQAPWQKLHKNYMGAGERWSLYKVLFSISHSRILALGIPYDWPIVTVHFITYITHLTLHTQSLANMLSMWNPPTPHLLMFWHLTFWHQKQFFRKWKG